MKALGIEDDPEPVQNAITKLELNMWLVSRKLRSLPPAMCLLPETLQEFVNHIGAKSAWLGFHSQEPTNQYYREVSTSGKAIVSRSSDSAFSSPCFSSAILINSRLSSVGLNIL